MSDIAIKVENLGKMYRLGHLVGYHTLRESLTNAFSAPFRRRHYQPSATSHELSANNIWALKDISFEVKQGEAIGIIGCNGAGKTTLLRILTRITDPTEGRAEIRGRVGSLLEVGTGFHAELTGRENIFLNGAILGMKKIEIERKFDEIVNFSGVEKFIDTPLKRYSSGMTVRLAFAVAAHMDPEILLVDEVLAVGDAEFRKKCLGKMSSIADGGRTVLFVSHNMSAISQLCESAIWLEEGLIKDIGPVDRIVKQYLSFGSKEKPEIFFQENKHKRAQYQSVRVLNSRGVVASMISCDDSITVEMVYQIRELVPGLYMTFYLQNIEGVTILFSDWNDFTPGHFQNIEPGMHTFNVTIPPRILAAGKYYLTIGSAASGGHVDHQRQACSFSLYDTLTPRGDRRTGVISTILHWNKQ